MRCDMRSFDRIAQEHQQLSVGDQLSPDGTGMASPASGRSVSVRRPSSS
jgi:hypothetical protein